ncbi:MAG: hypothetical protein WBW52_00520 [Desulfobaccales bacterium]
MAELEMVKGKCPKCNGLVEMEIIKEGIKPEFLGQVQCKNCMEIIYYCEKHKYQYEGPPPCPYCQQEMTKKQRP